jgi:hypothetical protein
MRNCYVLLRMRPLLISCTESFVVISCERSIMTNLVSETVDAYSAAWTNVVVIVMSTITVV